MLARLAALVFALLSLRVAGFLAGSSSRKGALSAAKDDGPNWAGALWDQVAGVKKEEPPPTLPFIEDDGLELPTDLETATPEFLGAKKAFALFNAGLIDRAELLDEYSRFRADAQRKADDNDPEKIAEAAREERRKAIVANSEAVFGVFGSALGNFGATIAEQNAKLAESAATAASDAAADAATAASDAAADALRRSNEQTKKIAETAVRNLSEGVSKGAASVADGVVDAAFRNPVRAIQTSIYDATVEEPKRRAAALQKEIEDRALYTLQAPTRARESVAAAAQRTSDQIREAALEARAAAAIAVGAAKYASTSAAEAKIEDQLRRKEDAATAAEAFKNQPKTATPDAAVATVAPSVDRGPPVDRGRLAADIAAEILKNAASATQASAEAALRQAEDNAKKDAREVREEIIAKADNAARRAFEKSEAKRIVAEKSAEILGAAETSLRLEDGKPQTDLAIVSPELTKQVTADLKARVEEMRATRPAVAPPSFPNKVAPRTTSALKQLRPIAKPIAPPREIEAAAALLARARASLEVEALSIERTEAEAKRAERAEEIQRNLLTKSAERAQAARDAKLAEKKKTDSSVTSD